jgi:hypothetical protein
MIDDRLGNRLSTNYTIWFVLEKLKTRIVIMTREREISVRKKMGRGKVLAKKELFYFDKKNYTNIVLIWLKTYRKYYL